MGRRIAAAMLGGTLLAAAGGLWFGSSLIATAATRALRDAGFPGGRVTVTALGLSEGWTALRLGFTVDFGDLQLAGERFGAALSGTGGLTGALLIRPSPGGIAVTPDGCLDGTADRLAIAGEAVRIPQGLRLCPPATGTALSWNGSGSVVSLQADIPRLDLPGLALRADAIALDLETTESRSRTDLLIRSLSQTTKPTDFVPLSLSLRTERLGEGPISLSGRARDSRGLLVLSAVGNHDPVRGAGTLAVKSDPVHLKPDGPGLAALSPKLGANVEEAGGTLSAKLAFDWGTKVLQTRGEILLKHVGARVGPVTLAGVNGTMKLASLAPPVIPDGQILSVALLDAGLPLTDGILHFGYGRDGRLDVDRAEWRWAGGTLRADPFEISPAHPKGTVILHAAGVDLGRLLALVEVDGLAAAGRLAGTLPMRIAPGSLRIDGGVLESAGPGTLSYDPAKPPAALKGQGGSAGDLLLGALTDFRYDSLKLTVDGQAGGELAVAFAIRGANPTFYDGHPVALNLKVSGALDRILRQSLETTRIPEAVRDRMTEFERKDP